MGSTGDPPVPVGDPPTGMSKAAPSIRSSSLAGYARPVPSGESPDGTGQWPVLPKTYMSLRINGTSTSTWVAYVLVGCALSPFPLTSISAC